MNEIATLDLSMLPSTQIGSDAAYDSLSEGGDFLGYIKLCNSDKYVKKDKIKNGHFGIPKTKEEVIDLGPSIDVLPLARRPKAIDLSDTSAIVTSYDETSDAFKDIKERSTMKDSGCQWGTSFLVLERSTGRFLELYFGTISCRPEAKNVFPALPLTQSDIDRKAKAGADVSDLEPHGPFPVTVKAGWKENKKGGWYSPVVTKCSTPVKPPASDVVVKQIIKFLTIKNDGAEKVQDTRKERAR